MDTRTPPPRRRGPTTRATSATVDDYIASCPQPVQAALRKIRTSIREVAPNAIETTDYFGIPGYSYPGYDYSGMFVWFSFKEPHIRLHLRPPTIENHARELRTYSTSKGIVGFPADQTISMALVKKLARASLAVMKSKPPRTQPKR
jgi:uncharacterized protein YdhG (YjbR/CyaY superfamily)